ncbi:hypothetical protein MES4922_130012 [Mesorhizobium ventifaucium]|uniref:Secreted peptide n=1 Tax=Mesorhizobium ventifaucium TaxID=666020 RepID=A0ABM9DG79_9HYPH|nr:hypothetical protein MES4922_130012 [Mesorhizobium ventifaucium]
MAISARLRWMENYFLRFFIPATVLALPGLAGAPEIVVPVIDTGSLAGNVSSSPSSSSSSMFGSFCCSCSNERTAGVF